MTRSWTGLLAVVATAAALAVAGCGGGGGEKKGGGKNEKTFKVGLVTDTNGINDRSFNHLSYVGLQRAQSKLGVQGRVVISQSNADYVPNLSSLARQHYNLVIGVGFLLEQAIGQVARRFPNTKFALVDDSAHSKGVGGAKNVRGLLFRQEQGGYIAGYLAALQVKKQGGPQVVGAVGGQKIPPVVSYIAGFQAGAKAANPKVKVLIDYSQTFTDQAQCKEITLRHIAAGSQAEIQLAGLCGLGVLDAAKERHIWGIGADADQRFLGPHILTSALKKVDVGVFDTIQAAKNGTFKGGDDKIYGAAEGAVGLGSVSPRVSKDIIAKTKRIEHLIAIGKITPPTTPTS